MFKKMRRLFSVALVLSMLTATGLQVGAYDLSEFEKSLEPYAEEHDNEDCLGEVVENVPLDNGISPRMMCPDCSWFMVSVCANQRILTDHGYHRGFLGIFETDCYAYYYSSKGAIMCPYCYAIGYEGEYHACWESHGKCSKGEYDVCPMEES
ncbi:hypothetical protein [uncultured Acetatifactor sp.]|uniref:hypothetical protein n=1 Tax=uncultured Acetatifactor sp. TaxID=1671927 RepID=UPI0026081FCF|nr:hypothetical protein [uncultured Acetatifactor sp.]